MDYLEDLITVKLEKGDVIVEGSVFIYDDYLSQITEIINNYQSDVINLKVYIYTKSNADTIINEFMKQLAQNGVIKELNIEINEAKDTIVNLDHKINDTTLERIRFKGKAGNIPKVSIDKIHYFFLKELSFRPLDNENLNN